MSNRTVTYTVKLDVGEMLVNLSLVDGQLLRRAWVSGHHCHASYELHVILEGKCEFDVEGVSYELEAGAVLLIEPGKYHRVNLLSDKIARFSLSFSLTDGELAKRLGQTVSGSKSFIPSTEFSWYVKRLIEESAAKLPLKDTATEALVALFSLELLRTLGVVEYVEGNSQIREEAERMDIIDRFFKRHYNEKTGCQALAREMHISTKQLNRVLKKHYGMGFQEKLIATRMEHASILLRTTSMRIQDIIEAVGYNSYEAFYKAFIAKFGLNPHKYRQANKRQ